MTIKDEMENLIRYQRSLKKKILLEEKKVPTVMFNNILFYDGMDFYDFGESDLLMSHAYLHNSYVMKKPDLDKKSIKKIHVILKQELLRRKQNHHDFDKLDADTT